MSSEFKSKAWRYLSDALGVMDPKGISKRVSTDPITPVVSLDLGMQAYTPVYCSAVVAIPAPQAAIQFAIVSPIVSGSPVGLPSFPNNVELETLIYGFSLSVDSIGMGDTANLKHVNVYRLLGSNPSIPVSIVSSVKQRWGYYDFATGKTRVTASFGASQQRSDGTVISVQAPEQPIWVPAGLGFQIIMDLDPVANWSAGGVVTAQAIGVQFPKGIRGPCM